MQAFQFEQYVSPSHRVSVELPESAPTGSARIIVLFPDAEHTRTPGQPKQPEFADIAQFLAWHDTQPASGRSPNDVDRQIREERDGWSD